MLTLLVTSTCRPREFALLEKYIARQTCQPDQWLVVGENHNSYNFTMNQQVVTRDSVNDPVDRHSICLNLLEATKHIIGDKVIICDDDDWYAGNYLSVLSEALNKAPLVGHAPAYNWNVTSRRWKDMRNNFHCSLGQTGFTKEVFETFKVSCNLFYKSPFVDMQMWTSWTQTNKKPFLILPDSETKPIHVGIKALHWGLAGAGLAHDPSLGIKDNTLRKFKGWVGEDWKEYY